MNRNPEEKFKIPKSIAKQSNEWCWKLENLESTISFGFNLTKHLPDLKILLLEGPLGAGKTSLVSGIAQSIGIKEPICSPTFALSQHYPKGKPPLIHLDLYRLENPRSANELFLQEEEVVDELSALMVVEWSERLTLSLPEAWKIKLEYATNHQGRMIHLKPPKKISHE